ncbi:MAG: pilus assembly protein TadB [Microbacterium sp.]|uniref:type II secretion system F family protein n=1 Tax=unclassified Microbacterium TaxID=2609290 RepID=UPI000DAFB6D8|nr:type II secretion system F family protein [Microbacterium sp.]PZU38813.1 MAG: pilus assembly protein TadB [Microbacterium sp.]
MALLRRRRRPEAESAAVAEVARRLAVLLQAGIAPRAAWGHLASADARAGADAAAPSAGRTVAATVAEISRVAATGGSIVDALRGGGGPWRDLAAAWAIATEVGAALADALRAFSTALADAAEARDDIGVALAEPAGTARLMLWLPVAGLALGVALGLDPLRMLLSDVRGLVCLGLGLALVAAGRAWTARLVRTAQPPPRLPGIDAELFAVALSGGVSIDRAAACVERALGPGRAPPASPAVPALPGAVAAALDLSRAAGVPAVELLRAEAAGERHRARIEGRARAARLSTRLLLPLGACTLPSFLLLAVVPLVLSVLGSTALPLV